MSVNFDFYRTFYYVGKYKNITAAAKALFVTQPTVTHAIQALERELNCSLFIRSQKGVSFTPEGAFFYRQIAVACETIFEAEQNLEAAKNLSEGLIAIGASETTLHHYLMPILADFRRNHPGIRLKLFNASTPAMLEEVLNGHMDFAVLVLNSGYCHDELLVTRLTDFQDIMIAGPEFSFLCGRTLSLKELSGLPLVSLEKNTLTRRHFENVFKDCDPLPEPDIELATTDLIVPVVENGLGIGLVPEPFARESLSGERVFRLTIKEPVPRREICLIQKKKTSPSIAGKAFIQYLLSDNR